MTDDPFTEKCPGTGQTPAVPSTCPVCSFEHPSLRFWHVTPYHRRQPIADFDGDDAA